MLKLNPECLDAKLLEEKKGVFKISHQVYKAPWPVSNRDFILIHYIEHENDKVYMVTKSCDYPYPEVNGVVRG